MGCVRGRGRTLGAAIAFAAVLAGCSRPAPIEPPPRAHDAPRIPPESSIIAVPIDADAAMLTRAIERAVPRTLWTIDRRIERCVAPQRVKLFGKQVKVTPEIGCTIVGTVTRGAVRLHGKGKVIVADLPIHAEISARDVGGVLKGETATGSAMAHARITLDLTPDWQPRATVALSYDWTRPPGIDFLGQRITFTDQADAKLRPVVRDLERSLPRELARLDVRSKLDSLWRQAFTSIDLNAENPPVWARITPRALSYAGYTLDGRRLRLNVALEAGTETFVGPRPADPAPTPLPPMTPARGAGQLKLFVPVVADYAQLEPVILRALTKRAARPFVVPGIGPVTARFDKVTAYGSPGGRIAVGLTVAARPAAGNVGATHGVIWIAAHPVNAPGSAKVGFRDLVVTGDTDGVAADLLLRLGNSPGVAALIADALGQNFTGDYHKLLGKIGRAIDAKRVGDVVIHADLGTVETGVIEAHGTGLYLPVRLSGDARITYQPTR
ncbi:DUF4403 family protein [Hephaestia sp. GCM10023244]|uniref:DUF4403 family protein n=1 Tax=unclassified Hephaestia TaxID=2631281 RepID=UPI002077571D|nr:DUF4403 family protein [Hephaestia sp. MAHUQ-44]MCM8729544.1 DUF4403 family protein [Hephaestia sp. MAHUQ-44]